MAKQAGEKLAPRVVKLMKRIKNLGNRNLIISRRIHLDFTGGREMEWWELSPTELKQFANLPFKTVKLSPAKLASLKKQLAKAEAAEKEQSYINILTPKWDRLNKKVDKLRDLINSAA